MQALSFLRRIYRAMTPRIFWSLMAVSTIAHVVFIFEYQTHPGVDGVIYQDIAHTINAADDWLACGAFGEAYWPPLFCIYLAAFWRIFGESSQWLFFMVNILTAFFTAVISVKYLNHIFGELTARWAAWLAYSSMIVFYFTLYYKYELLTSLLLSLCLLFIIPGRRSGAIRLVLAGIFMGLAALATGRVLALVPALLYFIVKSNFSWSRSQRWLKVGVFVVGIIIAIAPWTIRNYLCFDRLIPLTLNNGINFYMGFNEAADGSYLSQRDFPAPYDTWRSTDNVGFYKAGLTYIIDHPGNSIWLGLKKINIMWRIHYFDSALFYPFFYIGVFWLGAILPIGKRTSARTVQLIFLFYTLFHVLFIARYYYLLPLLPLIYGVAVSCQRYLGGKVLRRLEKRT